MQTGKRRWAAYAIILVVVICLASAVQYFLIGEPVDGAQIRWNITETGSELEIQIEPIESNVMLRGLRQRQEGETLFLSVRKVPASWLTDFFGERGYDSVCTVTIPPEAQEKIILGGKTIWTNNE